MKNTITFILLIVLFGLGGCIEKSQNQELSFPFPDPEYPGDEDDPLRDSLKQVFLDQLYFADASTNVDVL